MNTQAKLLRQSPSHFFDCAAVIYLLVVQLSTLFIYLFMHTMFVNENNTQAIDRSKRVGMFSMPCTFRKNLVIKKSTILTPKKPAEYRYRLNILCYSSEFPFKHTSFQIPIGV